MRLTQYDEGVFDLLSGIKAFCDETTHDVKFDKDRSLHDIETLLDNQDDVAVFLHYEQEAFAGFAIAVLDHMFTDKPFGDIYKFYVMPKFRGTKTARTLRDECTTFFDTNNVIKSWVCPNGAVGHDQEFVNLFKKVGYERSNDAYCRPHPSNCTSSVKHDTAGGASHATNE